jgi:Domain of unknown function (DUF4386)
LGGDGMNDRVSARVVGALFLVATAAGLVGLPLQQGVLEGDLLNRASQLGGQVAAGATLQLVMAVAVVGIAVVIYPVLRRGSERLALGYVAARVAEAVLYLVGTVWLLTLVTVSRLYIEAGSPEGSAYPGLAEVLLAQRDWAGHAVLDVAVFSVSALILNFALLRFRLVPAWLAVWGLVGAAAYLGAGAAVLFGATPLSTPLIVLQAPLGVQELALAVWLMVKGFAGTVDTADAGRAVPVG